VTRHSFPPYVYRHVSAGRLKRQGFHTRIGTRGLASPHGARRVPASEVMSPGAELGLALGGEGTNNA
jgi:hypothetical protein